MSCGYMGQEALRGLLVRSLIAFSIPLSIFIYFAAHTILSSPMHARHRPHSNRDSLISICRQNPVQTVRHSPTDTSFQPSPYSNRNDTTFIQPSQHLPKNPHNNLCSPSSSQPLQTLQSPHHNCSKRSNHVTKTQAQSAPRIFTTIR